MDILFKSDQLYGYRGFMLIYSGKYPVDTSYTNLVVTNEWLV